MLIGYALGEGKEQVAFSQTTQGVSSVRPIGFGSPSYDARRCYHACGHPCRSRTRAVPTENCSCSKDYATPACSPARGKTMPVLPSQLQVQSKAIWPSCSYELNFFSRANCCACHHLLPPWTHNTLSPSARTCHLPCLLQHVQRCCCCPAQQRSSSGPTACLASPAASSVHPWAAAACAGLALMPQACRCSATQQWPQWLAALACLASRHL